MRCGRILTTVIALAGAAVAGLMSADSPPQGVLVFHVRQYTSGVILKETIQKQLEHGFLEWGLLDKTLILTMVNKKYVKPELQYSTRYGSSTSVQLTPGDYSVTCIGYIHGSNSRDIEKVLSKSAFFNVAILKFNVLPGRTTTLEVSPTMQKQAHMSFAATVKVYMPDLKVGVYFRGHNTYFAPCAFARRAGLRAPSALMGEALASVRNISGMGRGLPDASPRRHPPLPRPSDSWKARAANATCVMNARIL